MLTANSRYPHPGKFEGERMLTAVAYDRDLNGFSDESFGDVETIGYYFSVDFGQKYGMFYGMIDSNGFVSEISEASFHQGAFEANRRANLENELEEAQATLDELRAEDKGRCDDCNVIFVTAGRLGGARVHEAGCPFGAKIRAAESRVESLEEAW